MDRTTAESLLRGDRHGHPLADLLSAAAAPATDRELAGEATAMAAFRAAAHSPAPAVARRRNPMLKLLTFKVAAAAFATTATVGGVALAASTGALPNPMFASSSAEPSRSPESSPSWSPRPKPSDSPKPSSSARPRPKVADLCTEFDGRDRDGRWRALDDDHFRDLVRKAGKKDRTRVENYCFDLRRPGVRPSGSVRPSGYVRPSGSVRPSFGYSSSARPQPSFSARPGDGDGDHDGGFPGDGDQDR
ncbi:hypothetical protein [Actinoplanes sp. OR16]|uniref:hypothetical protein n=1 Tax=Actinoplanes sp. OR16 TaxID=946334 RepID=UPI000FDC6B28|nr:hypothetical protein [Actinoplanes sp. OR16]